MHRTTRHSAGAALDLRPDGILMVRLFGPLTGAALQHVKAEVVRRFAGQRIRAFVVDYTGSVVALTGAELDAVLEGEDHSTTTGAPAALVVNPECAELFRGHCLRVAARGLMRRTFLDLAPALVWALREAGRQDD